jgi:hypothetical protein
MSEMDTQGETVDTEGETTTFSHQPPPAVPPVEDKGEEPSQE